MRQSAHSRGPIGVLWTGLVVCFFAISGCEEVGIAPEGTRVGWRLPFAEAEQPVADWTFAADLDEIAIETGAPWGWHSVIVWCAVVDGRLYVATDSSETPKRWVREIEKDKKARVGIRERAYPVVARSVAEAAEWNRVVDAYLEKYRDQYENYDFPKRDDLSKGRVYELRSDPDERSTP